MARVASILALVAGFILVSAALFGGGGHEYKLLFETGGQLVPGNQVLVAGQPIGTVDEITLTDDAQAEVQITVDEPLHEGSEAVIRTTSLSGIANRYVSISPGPDNAPELEDGATITPEHTTTPVDLDQLFDTLDEKTRASLQKVIQGSATLYTGNNEGARETYKYLAPSLQSTDRLLQELTRDDRVLSEFLVSGSRILGAVAERRQDLSALTSNANQALGAIAQENESLDRSLAALPPAMRQADTTFVNLRAALDDLDPLVATAKRATVNLPEFLRDLRPVAERAVPVVSDLRDAVALPGPDNDLTDVLRLAPKVERKAARASTASIDAMDQTQDDIEFVRPYTPDLMALITRLGEATAYYDGNGHYARVTPTASGAFSYNAGTEEMDPLYASPGDMFDFFTGTAGAFDATGFARCPGSASQDAADGSSPFLDDGALTGLCDPNDVPIPGAAP